MELKCTIHPRTASESGFGLLELLVSVVVILLTVPFLAGLEIRSSRLGQSSEQQDLAVRAAQAKFAELRLVSYDDIAAGSDTATLPDGRTLTRSWTVQNNKPSPKTKTVTVTVVDDFSELAEPVDLSFVIADRVPQ